ncbi:hypothetical protein B0H16DRAFT_1338378 [Mycena metata]|uniref:Restriction of telomere capping protein 4 n=1 Tax=Mycena metata TaxID=1033252 RepID=A0AAD7MHE0_9AGAR|nr:hypothetical protein B0H16DRAFT_1338378 [Mycena metata]
MLEAAERQTPTASIIAPLCAQHELEDLLLPMAIRNGWPQELDLPNIEHRLKAKKAFFEAFINNEEGIRDGNIFWMNAIAQLARPHGGALGGTFTTFHLTQPGYYGEQGTRKIHDTFYRLLQISPESADPLTPLQLMDLVLIPEAGVQLILDDFGNGMERATAIATMYESGKYGAQMFPAE